jgi:hypothetical protein
MSITIKREPLATSEYFEQQIIYEVQTIARFEQKLADSEASIKAQARMAYTLYRKRVELLLMRYSAGEAVSDIKAGFPDVVLALERYEHLVGNSAFFIDQSLEDYVSALWLVSFAIIFNVDHDLFLRLIKSIGRIGEDRLLDVMISSKHPLSSMASTLLWPKPYANLLEAIEINLIETNSIETSLIETNSSEIRVSKFKEFLSKWYPAMKNTYWHNSHTETDGGFFGYWCIEGAGAAVAFGFNTEDLNSMSYYPIDFVRFVNESR